ncbi:MAG: ABC transporter ATP-binding protein [Methylococcales bacterium]
MIDLSNIHREFQVGDQTVHALNGVELKIQNGEYVSVMGPSGSGKSTLLNIISLLDKPTSGKYTLNDRDVTELSDEDLARVRRENIGFVFQFFHLIPRLSAAENIEMPLVLAGIPPDQRKKRVQESINAYGLEQRADHRPEQLSGGQRQRVAIGRATIMQPGVILADEPTGNLDRQSGVEIIGILEALNNQGVTLVVVTHDPALGQRAKRKIEIVDGKVVKDNVS